MTEEFYTTLGKIIAALARYLFAPLLVSVLAGYWKLRFQSPHPNDQKKKRP